MDLLFDREVIGNTTRLILEIESRAGLDQFALKMINHNNIDYLAPMELMQYDSRNYLQYDISNKDTLDSRLSSVLKKTEVIQILNSIINAFEEMDAYMLSGDGMLLKTDRVYVDGQNHCVFLYLPFEQEHSISRISFLQEVVEHITPDYDDKDTYLFNILNAFNRGAISKIADLKEILRKNSVELLTVDEKPQTPKAQAPEKPQALGEAHASEKPLASKVSQMHVKQEVEKPQSSSHISFAIPGKTEDLSINIPGVKKDGGDKKEGKKKENKKNGKRDIEQESVKEEKRSNSKKWPDIPLLGKKGKEINEVLQPVANPQEYVQDKSDDMYESYEQTILMEEPSVGDSDSGATEYLNASENIAQLERKSTGECLEIARNNAIIGSGIGADCQITGNKAISRTHATISVQNGVFYITDNHSSNGTWVNGNRLIPNQAVEICTETLIKLANEEFIFKVR